MCCRDCFDAPATDCSNSLHSVDAKNAEEGHYQDSEWKEVTMTGYCLKCKESREMQETEQVTMKNGWPATEGRAASVGTGCIEQGKVKSTRYGDSRRPSRTIHYSRPLTIGAR